MFSEKINKISRIYIILLIVSFPILILSCNSDVEKSENNSKKYTGKPNIEFFKTTHDFGVLTEGEIVECSFRFKNSGKAPLKILSVDADCGCTVPEFSLEYVLPGKEGVIKAVFNSEGFRNNIYKTIDVETNADSEYIELVLTAFIEK